MHILHVVGARPNFVKAAPVNVIVGQDMARLREEVGRILGGDCKQGQIPLLWDGHARERIANVIKLWAS